MTTTAVLLDRHFSDQQFEFQTALAFGDRRVAALRMALAFCGQFDPDRALVSERVFGVLRFTIRVRHVVRVLEWALEKATAVQVSRL